MNRLKQTNLRMGRNARLLTATVTALVAVVMPETTGVAHAQAPVPMAPPVADSTLPPSGSSDVFQWTEIPPNQRVPLTRGVFDKGGYQLFDTVGETIVVPFTNQNLYVMKFAVSPDNTLYFVNENNTPVLYVPQNGYLENASVPGAKWYPFSEKFSPTQPVFLGVAPSYTEFVDIGWYPNTVVYGGYYCSTSYISGGFFRPTFGLTFFIGSRPYHSWHEYHEYVFVHPAPYHVRYINRPVYYVNHSYGSYGGGHEFRGYTGYSGHISQAGHDSHGYNGYNGYRGSAGHVFQGATVHHTDGSHISGGYTDHNRGTVSGGFRGTVPQVGGGRPIGNNNGQHSFHGASAGGTIPQPRFPSGVRNGGGEHTFHGSGRVPTSGDRGSRPSGGASSSGGRPGGVAPSGGSPGFHGGSGTGGRDRHGR